jgi:hypothetical protein
MVGLGDWSIPLTSYLAPVPGMHLLLYNITLLAKLARVAREPAGIRSYVCM